MILPAYHGVVEVGVVYRRVGSRSRSHTRTKYEVHVDRQPRRVDVNLWWNAKDTVRRNSAARLVDVDQRFAYKKINSDDQRWRGYHRRHIPQQQRQWKQGKEAKYWIFPMALACLFQTLWRNYGEDLESCQGSTPVMRGHGWELEVRVG